MCVNSLILPLAKMEKAGFAAEYTIVKISDEYSDKVNEYLSQHFIGYDPITEYLFEGVLNSDGPKLSSEEFFATNKKSISQGHSWMALSRSGDIIGVLINEKMGEEMVSTNENLKILLNVMNKRINDILKCDNQLLLRVLSVHKDYNNKGIGKNLLKTTIEDAKQKQFEILRIFCINAYSASASASCGFKYVDSVAFEDYKPHGSVLFKPKLPHTHLHGLALSLR